MSERFGPYVHEGADGFRYRIRVCRTHPRSGRFVPGVRFVAFEDMENRLLAVAGVPRGGAEVPRSAENLETLLRMARRVVRAESPTPAEG